MRKSRFTDQQVVKMIREADRDPIVEVAKRHGIQRTDNLHVSQAVR